MSCLLHEKKNLIILSFLCGSLCLLSLTILKIPEKINWECHLREGTLEWEQQVAMVKLFEEKPIWPRRSLKERLLYDGLLVKDECFKRYCSLPLYCHTVTLLFPLLFSAMLQFSHYA